jgi:Spore coat polysaccharide biosynthesis protein F, CMP-KDO synthetase homolog
MDATKLIAAIIQARLTSTRLPRKVLKEFKGLSVIEIIVERLKKSKKLDEIIVAIPK